MLKKNKNKTKKTKYRLPTVEEFLQYKPSRTSLEWDINDEGLVEIKVPKFKSRLGKTFCNLIHKDNVFTARMDKIGSLIWKHCDGSKTVKEILEIIEKEFPSEENLDQRLFLFLQQMHALHYINL